MNFRRALCLSVLFFILSAYLADAQMLSGTVVVGTFTQEDLVLAADSRMVTIVGGKILSHVDDDCKISAVNGKIIFASSGWTIYDGSFGIEGFDLKTEGQTLASKANIRSEADLRALADAWASRANTLMNGLAFHNLQAWKDNPYHFGEIADAIFVSRDASGTIMASIARILSDPSTTSAPSISSQILVERNDPEHPNVTITLGEGEFLMQQIATGQSLSPRLDADVQHRLLFARTVTEMTSATLAFAQLAEQRSPEMVGGPIDQIHLGPKGIEWLSRKKNCAQTNP